MYSKILQQLDNTDFPKNYSRQNISKTPTQSFVLGEVNLRGQKILNYKTRGISRWSKKFPELYDLLKDFIKQHDPNFEYTTIQLNKNIQSPPHIDKNNVGYSYIIGLGDYTGGNLVIEGKQYNIKNTWKKFDGRLGHWVEPFQGTRYTIIYFTHTFKPPCPSLRKIIVTKEGLYNNDELIKQY